MNDLRYSRLRASDLLPLAAQGLRVRRLRAGLSVLGIAIGIAAIVAVLGITRSSQSDLLARIDRLGTNLLTVVNGQTLAGDEAQLPATAAATIGRTDGVQHVAATAELPGVRIYRTDRVPSYRTNGLAVRACDTTLLSTLDGQLLRGRFLDAAAAEYPIVVLGYDAAKALGIARVGGRVWLGGEWFHVIGILAPFDLAPEVDTSALIGFAVAQRLLGHDLPPTRVFVRADTAHTAAVASLLARATNPRSPQTVLVSRPSDALAARLAVAGAATGLFLGLGAVALLVGAIGIANVMVVSVLERRREIGLRRALGAARRHVAAQFLGEALGLAALGTVTGVVLGGLATWAVALYRGWPPLVPVAAAWVGLAAAVLVGAIAGVYPAVRAARLSPTEALRTT